MPKPRNTADADMAAEYDFSKGVPGKYAARYAAGSNIAVIDKDLATLFPNSETVNQTLRLVAKLRQMPVKAASRPRRNRSKPKAALKTHA